MIKYTKVIIDGISGSGKSERINKLRELIANDPETNGKVTVEEHGILREAIGNNDMFDVKNKFARNFALTELITQVNNDKDTLYIVFDAPVIDCQRRILKQGNSIEDKHRTFAELCVYREKYLQIANDLKKFGVKNIYLTPTCTSIDETCMNGILVDAANIFHRIKPYSD